MTDDQLLNIPFPVGGMNEYHPFASGDPTGQNSPPTTQSALNMRGVDPRSGRVRGGVRSGLSKYVSSQINGSNAIQEIASVVGVAIDVATDTGQILMPYVPLSGNIGWQFVTGDGVSYATVATQATADSIGTSYWSSDGFVYVTAVVSAGSNYKLAKYDRTGTVVWSITFGTTGAAPWIPGVTVTGTTVYVHIAKTITTSELWRFSTVNGANLDSNAAWKSTAATTLGIWKKTTVAWYANSLAANGSVLAVMEFMISGGNTQPNVRLFNTTAGTQISSTLVGSASSTGSQPLQITPGPNGGFYAVYTSDTGGAGTVGNAFVSSTGTASPTISSPNAVTYLCYNAVNSRLFGLGKAVQEFNPTTLAKIGSPFPFGDPDSGNFAQWLLPMPDGGVFAGLLGSPPDLRVYRFDTTLTVVWSATISNGSTGGSNPSFTGATNSFQSALPALSGRTVKNIAISGGAIRQFTSSSVSTIGGASPLNSTAAVIFSAQLGPKLFFADGISQTYYDAYTNQILTWTPDSGLLPVDDVGNKPRLICLWRNRLVQSGLLRDPQNWFMSASGDAFNYNYAPDTVVSTQAVAGNNSDAGLVGDIINTMIPYNDDLLLFGGDHTIYQMSGDPMAGGQIDRVSDSVGMSWGRPWCKAPDGSVFFFGSRGGVYNMAPGGMPQKITSTVIDHRLSSIDFSSTIIRMAWDDSQQGLNVFISPLTVGTPTTHLWFDVKNGAWWIDQFANTNHNPLTAFVFDGDSPGDRVLLLGGRDGYIRKVDTSATTDDGTSIQNYVFMGPFMHTMAKEIQCTLAEGSGNVNLAVCTGNYPQAALRADPWPAGTYTAGINHSQHPMIYGGAVYLQMASSNIWQFEQLFVRFRSGTPGRQRIF